MAVARARSSRREFLRMASAALAAPLAAGRWTTLATEEGAPAPTDSPWRIGCYTRPWAEHDYRVALDAVAEAGFTGVGLMTTKSKSRLVVSPATDPDEAARVGEEVKRRKLEVLSVYGGGIPVEKSLEAGIQGLRRLVENCSAVGARSLLMGGVGNPKAYEKYYDAIAACADEAERRGLEIALKPHGGLNATGPECRRAVEKVDHRNFRIWYDPGNILYYSDGKLDPVEDAPAVKGLVTGMCVKDYRHPKNVLLTPGTGQVDFPRVLQKLADGGFRGGSLVVETLSAGDLPALLREAKKARAFVEGLIAKLGGE